MKKIDVGELVNNSYDPDEVIEIISHSLPPIISLLTESITTQNWGNVGVANAQLHNITNICLALNEKVNGKKEKVVL